jgi:hypothetical protein
VNVEERERTETRLGKADFLHVQVEFDPPPKKVRMIRVTPVSGE